MVLVLDPSDPFSCWRSLAQWQEWRRETGGEYHVVLSRSPAERARLLGLGVTDPLILEEGIVKVNESPVELKFTDSTTVFYAYRVRTPDSPLLEILRRRDLAESK